MDALRKLAEALLALAAASPLIIAGLRGLPRTDQLKQLGWATLVLLASYLATNAPLVLEISQPGGLYWNWLGKTACLLVLTLLICVLPSGTLQKSGLLRGPSRDSAWPIFAFVVLCGFLGWAAGIAPGVPAGIESLAFQSLMPSLAEEPVYRAILPALLSTALGSPWKIAGAQVGWWWLVCAMVFGAGHGIVWSSRDGLEFYAVPFVATGIIGLFFGWLAARCLSVWPCVVCHSLINATGLSVAIMSK